jgi:DNA modification methylase
VSLPKPYYEDTRAGMTIYHGDCREILPLLGTFDLLLTDPPYGVEARTDNFSSGGRGKWLVRHDYPPVAGDNEPFAPAPLLDAAASLVLWGANNYASRLPDSLFWLGWDRVTDGTDSTNLELAWTRGTGFKSVRIFRHQWCGVRRASEAGRRPVHPTQKPVALMSWCLSFFPEAKTVVDPYMGSGPVAKACKDRGLRYVGIELVEKYCEIAVNRLRQEVLFGGPP